MDKVQDVKPQLARVGKTTAVFQDSTTLWSDTVATWSDAVLTWGGSDTNYQDIGPNMKLDKDIKPNNQSVVNL